MDRVRGSEGRLGPGRDRWHPQTSDASGAPREARPTAARPTETAELQAPSPPFPRVHLPVFGLLLLLPLLAACGADLPGAGEAGASSEAASLPLLGQAPGPDTLHLEAPGSERHRGEVYLVPAGDSLIVTLEVEGLPGEGHFPSGFHRGTCAQPDAEVEGLNPVRTDYRGVGGSSTSVDRAELREGGATLLLLHRPGGEVLACAQGGRG